MSRKRYCQRCRREIGPAEVKQNGGLCDNCFAGKPGLW